MTTLAGPRWRQNCYLNYNILLTRAVSVQSPLQCFIHCFAYWAIAVSFWLSELIRLQLYSDAPSENKGAVPTSMDVLAFQGKYGPQKTLYPLQKPLAELMDVSVKPVDHRNYAFIWFSLSASTAALGLRAIKKGKVGRGRRWDKEDEDKDIISSHNIISHLMTDTWCLLSHHNV